MNDAMTKAAAHGEVGVGRETTSKRYARIHRVIRERISMLQYAPGRALSETELAREFGTSRTPIRRVLHQLSFEGLVESKVGVGTIVTDVNLKALKEIYDLRMALAELMGDLNPRQPSTEMISEMEKLVTRAHELREACDTYAYAQDANDLHDLLLKMIGNKPLREMTDILYYRTARIWVTFLPDLDWDSVKDAQVAESTEMLEAMKRSDIRSVGQVRRFHLHGILSRLSSYLLGQS